MLLEIVCSLAGLFLMGIEAAYVPTDGGGGDYIVRVEPDLVRSASPYTFTSDVPADSRDVRRVKIYVADAWPPAVERSVQEAARRPRVATAALIAPAASAAQTFPPLPLSASPLPGATPERPWGLLIGSLLTLFLSLGANAYLGLLLANMRQRYLRDIQQGVIRT